MRADYLDIDGTLSFVTQEGEGPAVLLLHTAGQNGVQWRYAASELAALGYRVIVPDLPGHGRSEPAPGGPVRDLGDYAAWCLALLDRLEVERPFVAGCSIGGRISLDLAVRAGDRLAGVVSMAAHAGRDTAPLLSVRGLERELNDVAAPSRTDRTYYGTLAVVGRSVAAEKAELIAQMHRREDPAISSSDLIGWTTHDVSAGLGQVACPVHVVVGDDDLWITPADAERTAAAIPRGRYTLLEGIGHYPMEELDGFAAVLHGWLKELVDVEREEVAS